MPDTGSRARVDCVIAAGRRIAGQADALGVTARRRLVMTSGLSPEGVHLALTEHLETHPDPRDVDMLMAGCGRAPRCHLVLSANVCTAALRAIALAAATSAAVFVRPSRRDPVVAELVVQALHDDPAFGRSGGSIEITPEVRPLPGDELHLYGMDETIRAFLAHTPPGVVVRAHGTGFGIAVVDEGGGTERVAQAIARDVVPFDQRGCLSPRVLLVGGGPGRARALAEALDGVLADLGKQIPRGPLDAALQAEIAHYRAVIESIGQWWQGPSHAIGLDVEPRAWLLPPAARAVHIMPVSPAAVGAQLAPWAQFVAAVGTDGQGALSEQVFRVAPQARRSPLGVMQKPPLDGPVDLRRRQNWGEPAANPLGA